MPASLARTGAGLLLLAALACGPNGGGETSALRAEEALSRGDLVRAAAILDDAIPDTTPSDALGWRLRLLQADVLLERGDTPAAVQLLESLGDGQAASPTLRSRGRFLTAKAQRNLGQFDAALDTLESARAAAAGDAASRLAVDWLAGQVHLRLGQWEQGEQLLEAVAAQASAQDDRPQQALAYLDLGMSRLVRSRYDEALVWFERVLSFSDLEHTPVVAKALNNAGICYSRLGLFERAMQVQQRAIAILKQRGPSRELSEALGSLGVSHGLQGDYDAALPFLEQAKEVAAQSGNTGEAALWAGNMASAQALLGRWDAADRLNAESRALGATGSRVKPVYNTLTDADVAMGRGDLPRARRLYSDALAGGDGAPAVTWSGEVGLAIVSLAEQRPDEAARHYETALATVEKTRSELLKTDYRLSFLGQLIQFYRGYVEALVTQGRSDRALEIADSSRGRVLAERQRVAAPARAGVAGFRRLAAETRTTLLSYWLAPTRSFLWVVSGSGIRRIDLPPAAEIEAAVRDYRAMIDNTLANPLEHGGTPGDRLYQMLVAPAALPRNASVIVVPDGALHGVNFETLPVDGATRRYWIADAEVQVAPSLAMLTTARPRAGDGGNRLLLIGNPTPRPPEFPALSYAPAEMTSIVRHFPQDQVTAYDSARATPAVYQDAALDRFSMIHFTAHATANVESPLDSAVVLSGSDTSYKLYARDVADKPLTAELVTVSACRSAGERAYSGEGLVGFAWAFLRAGAHRVVAGLWDVDDRSTARLMDALYDGVTDGQPPAAALRAAKLALIASGGQLARPYYWGPFQLFTVTP